MTPFELAQQLQYNTATHNALNDLGNQGLIESQRNFQLMAAQKESELLAQREQARMGQEQRNRLAELTTAEQLREKGNTAETQRQQQLILNQKEAEAKQINPDFKPDTSQAVPDRIAAAERVGYNKTLNSLKASADNVDTLRGQALGLVDAMGKPMPIDQNRLNEMVIRDPTLVKVLNAQDIQKLRNGMTPEQLAAGFTFNSNKAALLTAAQTARQALGTEQANVNAQKLGITLQDLQGRYQSALQTHNAVSASLPPDLQAELSQYVTKRGYQIAQPTPTASGGLDANGLHTNLSGGAANTTPAPTTTGDTTGDPVLQNVDFKAAINSYQGALARQKSAQSSVDSLSSQILNGDNLPVDQREQLAKDYKKSKSDLAKAMADRAAAEKEGASVYHQNTTKEMPGFFSSALPNPSAIPSFAGQVGNYPGGTNYSGPSSFPAPPGTANDPRTQSQLPANFNPFPQQGTPAITPLQVAPTQQPNNAPAASLNGQPSAMNNPFPAMDARNRIAQIFGTSDPAVLERAKQYALQNGATPDQLNQQLQAAISGDPNAIAQARQTIAAANSSGVPQSSGVAFGA